MSTHPNIPSPVEQVRHFIVRVDNEKCREFKIHCVNESRSSDGSFPKTVQDECGRPKFFVPLVRVRPNNPNSMVFSAEFTGICYSCGNDGHRASNCRSRKRVDEKKKKKSYKGKQSDAHKLPKSSSCPTNIE